MKRILALIVVFATVFAASAGFAEEELEPFYVGIYRVGKDLNAGSYVISLEQTGAHEPTGYITIYETEEDYKNNSVSECIYFGLDGVHVSAVEGMVFDVETIFTARLWIKTEKYSWMPEE